MIALKWAMPSAWLNPRCHGYSSSSRRSLHSLLLLIFVTLLHLVFTGKLGRNAPNNKNNGHPIINIGAGVDVGAEGEVGSSTSTNRFLSLLATAEAPRSGLLGRRSHASKNALLNALSIGTSSFQDIEQGKMTVDQGLEAIDSLSTAFTTGQVGVDELLASIITDKKLQDLRESSHLDSLESLQVMAVTQMQSVLMENMVGELYMVQEFPEKMKSAVKQLVSLAKDEQHEKWLESDSICPPSFLFQQEKQLKFLANDLPLKKSNHYLKSISSRKSELDNSKSTNKGQSNGSSYKENPHKSIAKWKYCLPKLSLGKSLRLAEGVVEDSCGNGCNNIEDSNERNQYNCNVLVHIVRVPKDMPILSSFEAAMMDGNQDSNGEIKSEALFISNLDFLEICPLQTINVIEDPEVIAHYYSFSLFGCIFSLLAGCFFVLTARRIKCDQTSIGKSTVVSRSKKLPNQASPRILKLFNNHMHRVLCVFGICSIYTSAALVKDPNQGYNIERADGMESLPLHGKDTSQLTFVAESADQLNKLTRGLRGNTQPVEVVTKVQDIAAAQLDGIQSMQKMHEDGDDQGLASALKSIMSEGSAFAKTSDESKGVAGLAIPNMDVILDSLPDLKDVSDSQVAEFYQPELMNQVIDQIQYAIQALEDVKVVFRPPSHRNMMEQRERQRESAHKEHTFFSHESNDKEPFSFDKDSSEFGPKHGKPSHGPHGGHPNRKSGSNRGSPKLKLNAQSFPLNKVGGFAKILRQARASGHSQLLDLSRHFHIGNDAGSSSRRLRVNDKHQRRTEALDVCRPKCEPDDLNCNCDRLVGCINDMTDYDLGLLFVEGYVETDPNDEQFANFTVEDIADLLLFDADFDILGKIERIKQLTNDASSMSGQDTCTNLLSELHSACNPFEESCSNSNEQSFQLSIDDVCDAVNTSTKLLLALISDELDGYASDAETSSCGNDRLAFAACNDFAEAFDLLYEHRDKLKYPHINPMRMDPSISAEEAEFIQFPTRYNFIKTSHGVTDLDFGTYTASSQVYNSSSFSTFHEIRSFSNPEKCVTIVDDDYSNTCWDGQRSVQMEDCQVNTYPNQDFYYDAQTRQIKSGKKCLDDLLRYDCPGLFLTECTNEREQMWYYDSTTNELKIFGRWNDCLGYSSWGLTLGSCDGGDRLKFAIPSFWLPAIQLKKIYAFSTPGDCMTTFPGNDRNVYMDACDDENENQDFVRDNTEQIMQNGLCLSSASAANGDNVQMSLCTDETKQKWYYNTITKEVKSSANIGTCLDTQEGSDDPTSINLFMSSCNEDRWTDKQKFVLPFEWFSFPAGAYHSRPITKQIWEHTHCRTDMLKDIIGSCDDSMSLLLGSTTSLGTLRAIAKLIREKGPARMPGTCCLDLPTTSQYFGYHYDPQVKDSSENSMQCENTGPWHLGISPEACNNAGGRWFRTPCVTLKDCIDNRPTDTDDHFSRAFEDFAIQYVIDDPRDEAQCQEAREGLGFESDHPYDTEVCQEFESYMCDSFFDGLDVIVEELDEPPEYDPIEFEDIDYGDDPPLSFEKLPAKEPFMDPKLDTNPNEGLVVLQKQVLNLGHARLALDEMWQRLSSIDDCKMIPSGLPVIGDSLRNICEALRNFVVLFVIWIAKFAVEIALETVSRQYELATLGPDAQMNGSVRAKSLFDNFKSFDMWNHQALGTINKNINTQHTEMRGHLQERHEQMANDINKFTADVGNNVGHYIMDVSGMIYEHHKHILESLGAEVEQQPSFDDVSTPDIVAFVVKGTGLAIAVDGVAYDCKEGSNITALTLGYNNPNQHFQLGENGEILSTMCSNMVIEVENGDGACSNGLNIQLGKTTGSDNQKWIFGQRKNRKGSIKSVMCPHMNINLVKNVAVLGETRQVFEQQIQGNRRFLGGGEGQPRLPPLDVHWPNNGGRKIWEAIRDIEQAAESNTKEVKAKVDSVVAKVDAVEAKVDAVETKVNNLSADIAQLKEMMSKMIESLEQNAESD